MLGRGGYGEVFLAFDKVLKEEVAVKIIMKALQKRSIVGKIGLETELEVYRKLPNQTNLC